MIARGPTLTQLLSGDISRFYSVFLFHFVCTKHIPYLSCVSIRVLLHSECHELVEFCFQVQMVFHKGPFFFRIAAGTSLKKKMADKAFTFL
jgi:hypothetical protein